MKLKQCITVVAIFGDRTKYSARGYNMGPLEILAGSGSLQTIQRKPPPPHRDGGALHGGGGSWLGRSAADRVDAAAVRCTGRGAGHAGAPVRVVFHPTCAVGPAFG